ncbi:hypothetical protein HGM15179_021291 [Zosterops borbonicus]|uniref:Uncharacterized protein n=1 Tax=Zosterops borbonicus TaxID=364589 RepID=A0A8K1D655_9PASS|nr:hypothetical protein HGM15179_021291 [Zosterops borbonicus]
MIFRIPDTRGYVAFWSFGNEHIVAVEFWDPSQLVFYKGKYKTRFTVSEDGQALSISQLRMEDARNYSVTIGRKTFTFNLQVHRKLEEPTMTCESQDSSGYRLARPASGLSEISATAGQGQQVCLQAVNYLRPVPGPAPEPAWDRRRTVSRRAFSAPPQITNLLRPEPGPTSDQLGPVPGLTMDLLRPVLGPASDQLGPEQGTFSDQL